MSDSPLPRSIRKRKINERAEDELSISCLALCAIVWRVIQFFRAFIINLRLKDVNCKNIICWGCNWGAKEGEDITNEIRNIYYKQFLRRKFSAWTNEWNRWKQ